MRHFLALPRAIVGLAGGVVAATRATLLVASTRKAQAQAASLGRAIVRTVAIATVAPATQEEDPHAPRTPNTPKRDHNSKQGSEVVDDAQDLWENGTAG